MGVISPLAQYALAISSHWIVGHKFSKYDYIIIASLMQGLVQMAVRCPTITSISQPVITAVKRCTWLWTTTSTELLYSRSGSSYTYHWQVCLLQSILRTHLNHKTTMSLSYLNSVSSIRCFYCIVRFHVGQIWMKFMKAKTFSIKELHVVQSYLATVNPNILADKLL